MMTRAELLEAHGKAHREAAPSPLAPRVYHMRGAGLSWEDISKALRVTEAQVKYAWMDDRSRVKW